MLLVCAAGEVCPTVNAFWAGLAVTAGLGAMAGGSPSWKTLTLARKDEWSLELQPRPRGASVRAAVRF